ncbi:MAG TPA: heme biosynthesis operon protein HemX [Alteromonas australica]|uniref:Heme biosynthesis operon protein HemX n=1 Tax=Alteromonas australica TaxID=589873 RepID=A0A350P048_9ALTE|nr:MULTISPECIES: uroporphyrinogen-III C-methyltransferase [Alteromonas]MBU32906.1 heme biosynthesis operon protein HemX [Alteromonas sp.]QPL50195.1 uroporphyrinogen-III C-methyltransferase [Alteromonas sp. B31-7]HAW74665.1 heme biosynthesis operon protein HemX [Alteromonas australica]|tara:strand:- start:288 stop:1448 length:1161 start_codon:yes stop_codon:yes gene_type:complete
MADNDDKNLVEGEVINTSAEPAPQVEDSASPKANKKKSSSGKGLLWIVVIILFLLVIGIAAAGYWYYTQQQTKEAQTASQQSDTQRQLQSLTEERTTLTAQFEEMANANLQLSKDVERLKQQNTALTQQSEATLAQLNTMEGRRPADWLIAEADYLVRMAGRKLWLENDVRTAILLLVNADKRLSSLADPSVLPVRAHLAEDIQTLQQLNPVSQTQVALALTGMMAQIDNLPLDTFEKPVDADAQNPELSESTDDWKENLSKVWRSMVDGFFTVKTLSGPIEPVMSLEAQFLAKEQLRLQLMHAQSAALQGEKGLFEQSLQYAQTLIDQNFDLSSSSISGFSRALTNLRETDISRPIPSQLASQQPLERLLDTRVKKVFGEGASAL